MRPYFFHILSVYLIIYLIKNFMIWINKLSTESANRRMEPFSRTMKIFKFLIELGEGGGGGGGGVEDGEMRLRLLVCGY